MFYKLIEEAWYCALILRTPHRLLEPGDKNYDGWKWYDLPPTEYLAWKQKQEENEKQQIIDQTWPNQF